VLLCCIGAANALANPKRALRVLPGALYELGMAVAVAVTLAPQLIESVQRVARARRLRGGGGRGLRALRSIAIPVLADALERALMLAAAMDSRGYGRSGAASGQSRRVTGGLMLTGLAGLCVGAYGLLDGTAPRVLGAPVLLAGALVSCAGLAIGGRRVRRTRYRPDPWSAPEWTVALCGVVCAALLYLSAGDSAAEVDPTFYPLRFPPLPLLPVIAILVAAVPAFAAPPPIRSRRRPNAPEASAEPAARTELVA
jgi:energy-coupling factor transport system permease protein